MYQLRCPQLSGGVDRRDSENTRNSEGKFGRNERSNNREKDITEGKTHTHTHHHTVHTCTPFFSTKVCVLDRCGFSIKKGTHIVSSPTTYHCVSRHCPSLTDCSIVQLCTLWFLLSSMCLLFFCSRDALCCVPLVCLCACICIDVCTCI